MKHILRKFLPLALSLALLLSLVPAALAAGGGEDEAEDEVTIDSVKLSQDTLVLGTGEEKMLTATIEPKTAKQTVNWSSDPEGFVELPKTSTTNEAGAAPVEIKGLKAGTATITAECGGKTATCAVTVNAVPISVENVTLTADPSLIFEMGEQITLTAKIEPANADEESNVTWQVTEGVGNVSLNKTSLTMTTTEVKNGASSITITGIRAGTAKISARCGSKTAACELTITGVEITGALRDGQMDFSSLYSTLNTYCRNITDSPLSYLTNISVSTAEGTLYEGYISEAEHGEGVSTAQRYYVSAAQVHQLERVTFVPRVGYSGTATITFTAYSESGGMFTGSIVVALQSSSLIYTSENGEPVCFDSSDFGKYIRNKSYGTLNYVKFDLPKPSEGTLYYNYIDSDINEGPVSASTLFHRNTYPALDRVWFVPKSGFSGVVNVSFTFADTSGATSSGFLQVHVVNAAGADGDKGDISYSVRPGASVTFKTGDFTDLCSDMYTGSTLTSVVFTKLPSSSHGTLYCGSKGKVTTSQNIYRTGTSNSWLLSDVYFTANANYSGTVSIPFTAATNKGTFTGTVMITVSAEPNTNFSTGSIITYSSKGEAVAFRSQDFFYDATQHLSQPLSTVRFYTPEVSQGRLCLNYGSPTSYAILDTSVEYPYTTTSTISFQPRSGFSGAAYVHFIAKDQSGKSYTGMLAVNVDPPTSSSYFDDMRGHIWAIPSVDFLARNNIVSGVEHRAFSPSGLTKRGDFILMLQRCFNFSSGSNNPFADVPAGSYYASAIAGAHAIGLAAGDGNGRFRPDAPLTRQEAAEFLYRCMKRSGSLQDGTAADLAAFSDRGQIAAYAVTAVATLVRLGVLAGDNNARMNPAQSLTRAEMAVMFHRALT